MEEWIKVSDKLPELYKGVIAWVLPTEYNTGIGETGTYVMVTYLGDGCWETWMPSEELDHRLKVVAWRELPKAFDYKEL